MSDIQTDRKLRDIFENKGAQAALDCGDEIVISVLLMREGGKREGSIIETHDEWFKRLKERVERA